jgi:hypothetical protein
MREFFGGLQQWALAEEKANGRGTKGAQYAFGVVMALNIGQTQWRPTREELQRSLGSPAAIDGYNDGTALIRKVRELGDAPTGDYAELLAQPRGQPFTRR